MRKLASATIGFLVLVATSDLYAQGNQIELLGSRVLKFDKKLGVDAQRLIGNVSFSHQGALMYCDSAYLYNSSNSLDAFGNVRVVQADTLTLNSDKLYYDGNTQYLKVRDHVVLRDREMTLKTHTLDYDRKTETAVFYDRGVITSTKNQNRLVACEGIYASRIEFFYFRHSVALTNPKYLVETDTLNYANNTEIAYFEGPTFIFSEENTIYCENGWYDTKKDISQFNENAYLNNGEQVLRGDSLWYSRNVGIGKAYLNVSIIDTTDRLNIYGDYGEYLEKKGKTMITGHAEMVQYDAIDSLFMHADTLLAVKDSLIGDRVFAYHRAKFFRKDLQGAADSIVFAQADSLIYMYKEPVLWAQDLQITGDTIQLKTADGGVQNLYVFEHAFMANRIDDIKYNQIKGKRLTGYFRDNDLYKVFIKGNGQSMYYASEEKRVAADSLALAADSLAGDSVLVNYIGVNKAICSNIAIYLANNKVERIMFLKQPDGAFLPLDQFPKEEAFFEGFMWDEERRPKDRDGIFE